MSDLDTRITETRLADQIAVSRRSLDLIGEGDWTRQDALHLMLADVAELLLAALAPEQTKETA